MEEKSNRLYAIAVGIGLALFPVHNKWLVDATAINGQATLFLPVFGVLIWGLATLFYLPRNLHNLDCGDKKIYIPLLVIVGAMGLSGITVETLGGKLAPLCMGALLFSLYLMARGLGKDIFLPLAIGAGVASVGVIISGLLHPGLVTGGVVFEKNYDIVVGYVLLGTALFVRKGQWLLASLALLAMVFSGSPEAVFVVSIMALVVLLRRDWGKKLAIAIVPTAIIVVVGFGLSYGSDLYGYTAQVAKNSPTITSPTNNEEKVSTIGYRLAVIKQNMTNIKPLGNGYNLTDFSKQLNVHNVPLVLVQQLGYPGIVAGIAWLWVTIWCLVRTKWKYVWVLVLALSVFDHFIWTQLAPWWWAIIGVTTASAIKTDLIFKNRNQAEARVEYISEKLKESK